MSDVIVVGSGQNGLVAAAVLGRAGLRPLVLEQAERVGGCAITAEIIPGFRCSTLSHRAALDSEIVRDLDLERHGLQIVRPTVAMLAPSGDGRVLTLWADTDRACHDIAAFSQHDANRYAAFLQSFSKISAVLRAMAATLPPSVDRLTSADIVGILKNLRAFRALDRGDAYRLLRWMAMPVADLVREWFDSEPLCATIAAGGTLGSFLGPRSPGSAAVLLLLGAGSGHPVSCGWTTPRGVGMVSDALATAARRAGAEIRVGARVREILVDGGAATGVILSTGERLTAGCVLSNADFRRTLLELIDPAHLPREFAMLVKRIRARGTLSKVNYAVSSPPRFEGIEWLDEGARAAALTGFVRLCPSLDTLERAFDAAKYGGYSDEPWIELAVPSAVDPALVPSGGHVVSAYVQYTPFRLRDGTWDVEAERLVQVVTRTITRYAPGFDRTILGVQVVTPHDLERTYGLSGGQIFHGELALDQLFISRPLMDWARFETPIRNLFVCGAGSHPGTGLDGRSGLLAARHVVKQMRAQRASS